MNTRLHDIPVSGLHRFAALLLIGIAGFCGGAAVAQGAPPPRLTVLNQGGQGGVVRTGPASGRSVIGTVDPIKTPLVERTFTLRNDNKEPVEIYVLQASCGCATVEVPGGGSARRTVRPREQVSVRLSLDVTTLRGQIRQKVEAFTRDSPVPIATLELQGVLRDPIVFSTFQLNFGEIPAGAKRSLPLTVAIDERLLAMGRLPELVSSNPDVGLVLQKSTSARGRVSRAYTVTARPRGRSGPVAGMLFFAPPASPGVAAVRDRSRPKPPQAQRLVKLLAGSGVSFAGRVVDGGAPPAASVRSR